MQAKHETDAIRPTDHAPLTAVAKHAFDSVESASASITAIWQAEADRLLKLAHRMVHKVDGADAEGIVSDTLVWALENWKDVVDAEHCRKRMLIHTRFVCRDIIKAKRFMVDATTDLPDSRCAPATSKGIDASVAWLFTLCANDQERHIVRLFLEPGNGTYESVSEATRAAGSGKWLACSWTVREVQLLITRLRKRAGVQLAAWRSMRFTTKGTMPGQHWRRHTALGSTVMLTYGPRPLTADEMLAQRHTVPCWHLNPLGQWVEGREAVCSTA